ncbi:MAG: FecR domain-containing protein [Pedobacter sp.]|uniref:FecR family protein n=1 Tax=Pedobacter sp. TaxID=1411316 RepID=UPI00339B82E7
MSAENELLLIMERISDLTATDAEIAQFNAWCDGFKAQEIQVENFDAVSERVLLQVHRRINKKPNVFLPLYMKLGAAVAVAVFIFSVWFFSSRVKSIEEIRYAADIAPGRTGATLTLGSGKKVNIGLATAGDLAMESGVKISKNASGDIIYTIMPDNKVTADAVNTLETSRGQQTQVQLPDGSRIFLNAASSLTYPASFANKKERRISLSGEGYFEIAKDKAHPFIVDTRGQELKVLGTHFNINAYSTEAVSKTTLLEGSIVVSTATSQQILTPGTELINNGSSLQVKQVDTELAIAWKNNLFLFDNEELGTIMRQVERWYDVEVIFVDGISKERFGGGVSRFDSVSKLLKSLQATGKVQFQIKGRKIYVTK